MSPLLCLLLGATPLPERPLTPEELSPEVYLDRSGLSELVIQNSILGGLAGFAFTRAAFANDVRAVAGLPLGAGAGVALPLLLTRRQPVHAAQASLYNLGERWGATNGALLPLLWGERDNRVFWGSTVVLFGVGLGASIYLYPKLELTPGQVSAIGTGQTFGTLGASLVMLLFDVVPSNNAAFAAPVLLFSNAGMLGLYLVKDELDVDRRRVMLIDTGGYLGIGAGIGLGFLITGGKSFEHKHQLYGATMLAGMVTGMAVAYVVTDDLDDYKQGADWSQIAGVTLAPPGPFVAELGGKQALGLSLGAAF